MKFTRIKQSNFSNQYGGLCLVCDDDGKMYLEMECGDIGLSEYFGPITEKQVMEFHSLCSVGSIGLIDSSE
jgi:hypothetical protein